MPSESETAHCRLVTTLLICLAATVTLSIASCCASSAYLQVEAFRAGLEQSVAETKQGGYWVRSRPSPTPAASPCPFTAAPRPTPTSRLIHRNTK